MAYVTKRRIYESLPGWLKSTVGYVPFSLLAGSNYRNTVVRNRWIDKASRQAILAYQSKHLKTMLTYAADEVPKYRHLRATVARLPAFESLKAFPIIDKESVQVDLPEYLPRSFATIPHYECATGGTSGNQLRFYVDDSSQAVEIGFMHRQWIRVGYTPSARKATFRGVEFPNLPPGVYWQDNPIYNERQFSPYHLNAQTAAAYLSELRRYRPQFMHGYPSAITFLAELASQLQFPADTLRIRAVLLGSEAVLPEQRAKIESVFKTRVFSWYGHSERVLLGGECEHTSAYHQFPDYGVLEVISESGEVVTNYGDRGELAGTGLLNRSLPLIRYRTGDRGRLLSPQCKCGRSFDRFDQVEGRWGHDFVTSSTGAPISTTALNMHGPYFSNVLRYQYVQSRPGVVELRLMVNDAFGTNDLEDLRAAFKRKVGDELVVEPVLVQDIPLTARGKWQQLIRTYR